MNLVGSSSKVGAARRRRRRLKGFASMLMDRNLSFCQLESAVVMSISTRFSALSACTVRWRSTKTKERPSKSSRLVRMLLLSFLSFPLLSLRRRRRRRTLSFLVDSFHSLSPSAVAALVGIPPNFSLYIIDFQRQRKKEKRIKGSSYTAVVHSSQPI